MPPTFLPPLWQGKARHYIKQDTIADEANMVESVDGDEETLSDHDTPCTSRDGHSNMSPESIRSSVHARDIDPISR